MKKESGNDIFSRGLEDIETEEESRRLFQKAVNQAFEKVFDLSSKGDLKWTRLKKKDGFRCVMSVKNSIGEDVDILVFLVFSIGDDLEQSFSEADLSLGGKKHSPNRNNYDPRVRKLIRETNASMEEVGVK